MRKAGIVYYLYGQCAHKSNKYSLFITTTTTTTTITTTVLLLLPVLLLHHNNILVTFSIPSDRRRQVLSLCRRYLQEKH